MVNRPLLIVVYIFIISRVYCLGTLAVLVPLRPLLYTGPIMSGYGPGKVDYVPTCISFPSLWCQAQENPFFRVPGPCSASHTLPLMSQLMNVELLNPGKSWLHEAASDSTLMEEYFTLEICLTSACLFLLILQVNLQFEVLSVGTWGSPGCCWPILAPVANYMLFRWALWTMHHKCWCSLTGVVISLC